MENESHTNLPNGNNNNKEQDRFLPIVNVKRIMKKAIPGSGKLSKDAKETIQECVSENFVTEYKEIEGEKLYILKQLCSKQKLHQQQHPQHQAQNNNLPLSNSVYSFPINFLDILCTHRSTIVLTILPKFDSETFTAARPNRFFGAMVIK
ncbi:hypothetical protein V8G54_008534 [Vigna mungo]|uniref:Transcription factor CBF/NF-Y/archaeal histone domain-containing protein n=1 Tax=Vigna mungo TaxID=3915 RepID=A0AAQ3S8B2_VIGMU